MYQKFGRKVVDVMEAIRGNDENQLLSIIPAFQKLPFEVLVLALQDNDSYVRELAARSLGKSQNLQSIEPLIEALQRESDTQVCKTIIYVLGEKRDKRGMLAIADYIKTERPDWLTEEAIRARYAAVRMLAKSGDVQFLPLLEYVEKNDKGIAKSGLRVKDAAYLAIESIKGKNSLPD